MKRVKPYFDDYAALEADVLLTSIFLTRVNGTDKMWDNLRERIDYLKSLIFNQ